MSQYYNFDIIVSNLYNMKIVQNQKLYRNIVHSDETHKPGLKLGDIQNCY